MCTAISKNGEGYCLFGRTLDVEESYREAVVITPRNYLLSFRSGITVDKHYAMIGIGCTADGYPLYFDAVNEFGVAMAALNFPESAVYHPLVPDKQNIASFELIPWILSRCANAEEALEALRCANIVRDSFSSDLAATSLHWMLSHKGRCFAVESVEDGLKIYEDPFEVLTNEPPFPCQIKGLVPYMGLSAGQPRNDLCGAEIINDSLGLGGIGLPGDHSSRSRFVRALFTKENTVFSKYADDAVNDFFHVIDTVSVPRGCVEGRDGRAHFTAYASCADCNSLVYHYTTYACRQIRSVALANGVSDLSFLLTYPLDDVER